MRDPNPALSLDTLAVHAGRGADTVSGAVAPALVTSTTFRRSADGGEAQGFGYGRADNPNRRSLETCLAALEGGEAAIAFASGVAAAQALFQTLAPGDHVVCDQDAYYGVRKGLQVLLGRWGLALSFVDTADLAATERAFTPRTRVLWIETPSNPLLKVADIAALAAAGRARGALVVCDNTFATPVLQRPLELGCDVVMHSTTKYYGGHSDVMGGALVCARRDALVERLKEVQHLGGAVPSPRDCWLLQRGAQTLPLRVRQQAANALELARWLRSHPRVTAVHYPGLPDHPGHAIAARQMRAFGAMLSFRVAGGAEAALGVVAGTRLFVPATSLGSVESLIEHRASSEGPLSTTPPELVRVSVGIEAVADLIADLEHALGVA